MAKFCSSCGSRLMDGAKFCSECGAKVEQPSAQAQQPSYTAQPPVTQARQPLSNTSDGLPAGMTRTPDGKIWWSFTNKKDEWLCYFDDESLAVMYAIPEKKSSAMRTFLKEAANIVALNSDNYPSIGLPFEEDEDSAASYITINGKTYNHYPYPFRFISAMKEDRTHGVIKLFCSTWWTMQFTPEQYDFALNHFLTHCRPDIKRK